MSKQVLAATAVLLMIAAGIWWLLKPEPPKAPQFIDPVALDGDGKMTRTLTLQPTLTASEGLDFQVKLDEAAFVYVFRVKGSGAVLEWGPPPRSAKLEPGVWALDWDDERKKGLRFVPGDTEVVILAARDRLSDADRFSDADLRVPSGACPLCSRATLVVHVDGQAAAAAARAADGGQ